MPYHLTTARTEPARTILFTVAILTGVAQVGALVLSWPYGILNALVALPICLWGVWASQKSSMRHMAWSSFTMGMVWTWSGLMRLIIIEGIGELLWVPFIIIGVVLGVCYLYFSFQRRIGDFG